MIIKSLRLSDFRNIEAAEIAPCRNINILLGQNAQGKTNLIEAVWLLTGNRSFRGSKESQMIRFGREVFRVEASFEDREREQFLSYSGGDKKRKILLNGVPLRSPSELMGTFPAVIFDPTGLSIVQDGPGERRKFLDTAISSIKPAYERYLSQYNAVLEQRNSLLRDAGRFNRFADTLDIWDLQLAKLGTILSILREDYVQKLRPVAAEIYGGFSGFSEAFSAEYESSVFPAGTELTAYTDERIGEYLEVLKAERDNDRRMRCTTKGAHRDDLLLNIDGRPARVYGSQGQKRSCAVALKLSEANLIRRITGEDPVVLLDDVMSELDQNRQDYILNRIRDFQVFITCCDISNTLRMESGRIFSVEGGKVEEA